MAEQAGITVSELIVQYWRHARKRYVKNGQPTSERDLVRMARLRVSIRRDLACVMREYHVAEATVRQYEQTILPKVMEALDLMQEAREAGEFDFLRVLTARRAYFDANIKYVVALGQLAQANVKLDGLLLTGGLSNVASYEEDDSLRSQILSGQ